MKKSQSFFSLLIFCLSFLLIPATDIAAMWDVPVGPGESFRWVFVTWGTTDATSSEISYYNDFVNGAADDAAVADPIGTTVTGVVGKSSIAEIEWRAIASTPGTNVYPNIGGVSTASIYTPYSMLVASGTQDLLDGTIDYPITASEFGGSPLGPEVWTGYEIGHELGQTKVTLGYYTSTDICWLLSGIGDNPRPLHLYAISEELTVVPVPGALMLAATGLLSMLGLKRWRRKH